MKKVKVLFVDDHPVIIEACTGILERLYADSNLIQIDSARNCDMAIDMIKKGVANAYDILFLDINIPASIHGKIIDGEDLALFAKKQMPNANIIILTGTAENHRIQNIINYINPKGLLIKSDINSKELVVAFKAVLNNTHYYSITVKKFLRKRMASAKYEPLDEINRKIIFYLSKGIKTKNLTKHVHLSLSAVEKRKSYIKQVFNVAKEDDAALLAKAKEIG